MKHFIIHYHLHECTNLNFPFCKFFFLVFYNFSELKTDEDDHWQQRTLFNEKLSKLQSEKQELEQVNYP